MCLRMVSPEKRLRDFNMECSVYDVKSVLIRGISCGWDEKKRKYGLKRLSIRVLGVNVPQDEHVGRRVSLSVRACVGVSGERA